MTSVAFQSYCYLIENATSKKPYFHYATYYLPIPHTAQAHWAISQKIDPLMCLTIDQSFYSMSYHNLFKNFSKKRKYKLYEHDLTGITYLTRQAVQQYYAC